MVITRKVGIALEIIRFVFFVLSICILSACQADLQGYQESSDDIISYHFSNLPEQMVPVTVGTVTGEAVTLREQPTEQARTIKQLNYEAVRIIQPLLLSGQAPSKDWVPIMIQNGEKGYIQSKYLRSTLQYQVNE